MSYQTMMQREVAIKTLTKVYEAKIQSGTVTDVDDTNYAKALHIVENAEPSEWITQCSLILSEEWKTVISSIQQLNG